MTPISAEVAACALVAAIVFSVALNALKMPICRHLNIAWEVKVVSSFRVCPFRP